MSKKKTFSKYMVILSETFSEEISKARMDIYWKIMSEYTEEEITAAFERATKGCVFFPKPVELIQFITGSPESIRVQGHDQAIEVLNAIKHVGNYKSVQFGDEVTQAVIARAYGGWHKLASELPASEQKWFIKEFEKHYYNFHKSGNRRVEHLPGLHEWENQTRGIPHEVNVVRIGMPERKQIEH